MRAESGRPAATDPTMSSGQAATPTKGPQPDQHARSGRPARGHAPGNPCPHRGDLWGRRPPSRSSTTSTAQSPSNRSASRSTGATYEIDLNAKNAKRLRDGAAKFVDHARTVTRVAVSRSRPQEVRHSHEHLQAVRSWGHRGGYGVSDRGWIPAAVMGG